MFPVQGPSSGSTRRFWAVAHRGGTSNGLENTLDAVIRAVRSGADAIEMDVRCTVDGEPVLHHDKDLRRLWGCRGDVSELTCHQLRRRAPLVPTLAEVLARTVPSRTPLLLDLKDIASALAAHRVVAEHGAAALVWYCGLPAPLSRIRGVDDDATLVLSWRRPLDPPQSLVRRLHPTFFNPWHRWVDARRIRRWHDRGIAMCTWTVDDPGRRRALLSWGIDAIISNDVEGTLADSRPPTAHRPPLPSHPVAPPITG